MTAESTDDPLNRRQYVSTPSERFTTTGETITLEEWRRRHASTYGRTFLEQLEVDRKGAKR